MGFRSGAFAKVWSVEDKGSFVKVRLSVSRKNKDTDQYEQTFSGFCSFVGNAKPGAQKLHEGDRIKLGDVDVTTTYNKDTKKEYTNFTVFSFEGANDNNAGKSAPAPTSNSVESNPVESDSGDGCPF